MAPEELLCAPWAAAGSVCRDLDNDAALTAAKQHDAVLDYYGRKLATCSSDRTIKIFEIEGETQRLLETLKG